MRKSKALPDPATLLPVGLRYTLQAAVAPAATPLPYGADRLFVPLSDGTVLLPSRAWFRPTSRARRIETEERRAAGRRLKDLIHAMDPIHQFEIKNLFPIATSCGTRP